MKNKAVTPTNEPARIRSGGCPQEDRFWYWYGASGRRYIHSVYEMDSAPLLPGAVYIAARRINERTCQALACGTITPADIADAARFFAMLRSAGAEELHVHLLASCPNEAARIRKALEDLMELPEHRAESTEKGRTGGGRHPFFRCRTRRRATARADEAVPLQGSLF